MPYIGVHLNTVNDEMITVYSSAVKYLRFLKSSEPKFVDVNYFAFDLTSAITNI